MKSIYLIFLGLLLNLPIGYTQDLGFLNIFINNGQFDLSFFSTEDNRLEQMNSYAKRYSYEEFTNGQWVGNTSTNKHRACPSLSAVYVDNALEDSFVYVNNRLSRIIEYNRSNGSIYFDKQFFYTGSNTKPDSSKETYRLPDAPRHYAYQYDAQKRLIQLDYSVLRRQRFTYRANGAIDRVIREIWRNNTWKTIDDLQCVFATDNRITQLVGKDSTGKIYERVDLEYNTSRALISIKDYLYNTTSNSFVLEGTYENRNLNALNKPQEIFTRDADGDEARYVINYYRDSLLFRYTQQYRDSGTVEWKNYGRLTINEFCHVGVVFTDVTDVKEVVFSISPNPVSDLLHVNYTEGSIHQIQIMGLTGQVLLQKDVNDKQANIDVSTLKSGFYLIRIQSDDGKSAVKKFIKN